MTHDENIKHQTVPVTLFALKVTQSVRRVFQTRSCLEPSVLAVSCETELARLCLIGSVQDFTVLKHFVPSLLMKKNCYLRSHVQFPQVHSTISQSTLMPSPSNQVLRLHKLDGMEPLTRLLFCRERVRSSNISPSSDGTWPERLLL